MNGTTLLKLLPNSPKEFVCFLCGALISMEAFTQLHFVASVSKCLLLL
jgi:hypothetical protein